MFSFIHLVILFMMPLVQSEIYTMHATPSHQIADQVPIEDITCNTLNGQQLVMFLRAENHNPVCVTLKSADILSQRGFLETSFEAYFEIADKKAKKFVLSSPTFRFDGIDKTLSVRASTNELTFPLTFFLLADFDSRHPGYGNRTGQALINYNTHHTMGIEIRGLDIDEAFIDDAWDE